MTETLNKAAFKDCDIRGQYPEEVHENLFERVGAAFGRQVSETTFDGAEPHTIVLGGDARASTPALREHLLKGVEGAKVRITDLGRVPTPVVYWAKNKMNAQASAIVTASHNPPNWNGLKVTNGPLPPTAEDIARIADDAARAAIGGDQKLSSIEHWNSVVDEYMAELEQTFVGKGIEKLSLVIDPGNGCFAGGLTSGLLERLGAKVTALHDTVDGLFRARHPDCAIPENLSALSAAVIEKNADMGIAFDGDGDRLAVVDPRGRVLGSERLAMILLMGALGDANGRSMILDIKCSMHLERRISEQGATPVRCKSGHAYMKRQVLERGAIAGVELSGHVFLGRIKGRDDPLYSALLLGSWLSGQDHTLAEMVDDLPIMFMTPDIRISLPSEEITRILDTCAGGLEGASVERLDGVRLVWPHGWVLARRSITEPKITIRLEGETPADLRHVGAVFGERFPDLGNGVSAAVEKALGS